MTLQNMRMQIPPFTASLRRFRRSLNPWTVISGAATRTSPNLWGSLSLTTGSVANFDPRDPANQEEFRLRERGASAERALPPPRLRSSVDFLPRMDLLVFFA